MASSPVGSQMSKARSKPTVAAIEQVPTLDLLSCCHSHMPAILSHCMLGNLVPYTRPEAKLEDLCAVVHRCSSGVLVIVRSGRREACELQATCP